MRDHENCRTAPTSARLACSLSRSRFRLCARPSSAWGRSGPFTIPSAGAGLRSAQVRRRMQATCWATEASRSARTRPCRRRSSRGRPARAGRLLRARRCRRPARARAATLATLPGRPLSRTSSVSEVLPPAARARRRPGRTSNSFCRPLLRLTRYFASPAAHCQGTGSVLQAEIARQASGRSKGWGLVDFASPQFAQNVSALILALL